MKGEECCRNIIENLPYAVIVHDGKKILFANRVAGELGGVSQPAQLIGRPITHLIHSDYHDFAAERIAEILKQGNRTAIAEEKLILPDGSLLDVEVSASRIEFYGQPAVLAMANDISQRKRIEKELRISEEKFRGLFNNANDTILIHTLNEEFMPGKFIEVNDTACHRLEYSMKKSEASFLPICPMSSGHQYIWYLHPVAGTDKSDWFIKNGKETKTERINIEFSDTYT